MPNNPFITYGYESPEYFCDRQAETKKLISLLVNENNVALISPRRMGKTGLICHCFAQQEIVSRYMTFLVDIYSTKNLADFVYRLGQTIVYKLKPWGQSAIDKFLQIVGSLRTGISFDGLGNASWNVNVGDIKTPEYTLDEIFNYLKCAEKPCIVAIDEFQTIADYPEQNVEALLRTYVQSCRNAVFVFAGSQRDMMSEMFTSTSRPFYQSVSMINLGVIDEIKYSDFATHHFVAKNKQLEPGVVSKIHGLFDGTTWYIQKVLNQLFILTPVGGGCSLDDVELAIDGILNDNDESYKDILYALTAKQISLLRAICGEGKAARITSGDFIKKYRLETASSVQKAAAVLLKKHIITANRGVYEVYDKFLNLWLAKQP